VLFPEGSRPLVIDPSPYWRPPAFASAIVVADAPGFHGAGEETVEPLLHEVDFRQYLLQPLIFGAVTSSHVRTPAGATPSTRSARPSSRRHALPQPADPAGDRRSDAHVLDRAAPAGAASSA